MESCEICNAEFIDRWRVNIHKGVYHKRKFEDIKQDRTRRDHLIVERGRECQMCHLTTWLEHKIPLELHHIDGNPENNEKSNLLIVCPNCHTLTPSYKGKNRGKINNTKRKETYAKYAGKYR